MNKNLSLKFNGEKVTIGSEEFVASPLPIGKMKLMASAFNPETVSESEMFENMIFFIHASLVRNHPDITAEHIEDNMTIPEATELFEKIIFLSGATSNKKKVTMK